MHISTRENSSHIVQVFFISQVVDWDDEVDNIFELEKCFSSVFNIFVNQWCVKKR